MIEHNKTKVGHNLIIEVKKEIRQKINNLGYQEYRLSQHENLKQFVKQAGWRAVNGDKLLEKAEGNDGK